MPAPTPPGLGTQLVTDTLGPDTEVLVSPGYLAGPGPNMDIFKALGNAAGWTRAVAYGTDTYFTSPCQRVRVANPVESYYGGWTISYAEDPLGVPDSITTFDRNTPSEIVAAFTETLVTRPLVGPLTATRRPWCPPVAPVPRR
ncbi:DUF317 domain-containing protein [Streptomyces fagopyri]